MINKNYIRNIVRKQIQEIFSYKKNTIKESSDPYNKSNERVPFNKELMAQAIIEGREVGILYKGDETKAPSGKYRLIYPVTMGTSTSNNSVVRAIHKVGQSESKAKETGVRSAEAKNVWRFFKTENIKGMWFTGNFFDYTPSNYNSNDRGMDSIDVYFDANKAKSFQKEFLEKQKLENEPQSKITRFKEKGERDIEQPYSDPETRIGDPKNIEPPIDNEIEELKPSIDDDTEI
jgi:hypothetical protein